MKVSDGLSMSNLHKVFKVNANTSAKVIKMGTDIEVTYKLTKPNILMDDGIVSEQFVHSYLDDLDDSHDISQIYAS